MSVPGPHPWRRSILGIGLAALAGATGLLSILNVVLDSPGHSYRWLLGLVWLALAGLWLWQWRREVHRFDLETQRLSEKKR